MNLAFKFELLEKFGSQLNAAKHFGITESRLSHVVREHADPSHAEIEIFTKAFGADKVRRLFRKKKQSSTGSSKPGVAHQAHRHSDAAVAGGN